MNAEIIAIGSELLTPYRQDTNSLYLTEKLNQMGVEVSFKTIVGDSLDNLTRAGTVALSRADLIIFMGGLGPTEDDLTREAVAIALGLPLRRHPAIVTWLEERFAAHGWKMAANNLKQAEVIAGATVLPNANGSAPGLWISGKFDGRAKIMMLLPGPPNELKALFEEQCVARLRAKLPEQFIVTRELKITGMGESQCDARVAPIYKPFTDVQTTILAGAGEIQLHLKTRAVKLDTAQKRVDELVELIEAEIGDFVFSDNGDSMEQIVGYYLQMRNATMAVAGVPTRLIDKEGAVSSKVATALAEGIRARCGSTLGIGVTGVAGPNGGTPDKPVGLVFHALASEGGTEVIERKFVGDRKRIRWFASQQALDMIRRKLK